MDVRFGRLLPSALANLPTVSCAALLDLKLLLHRASLPARDLVLQAQHHSLPLQEVLMRKSLSRPRAPQIELFHPPQQSPAWQKLPQEIRQKTVELLAQLLREHSRRILAAITERRKAMSDKIKPHHLERKAILYIRQSSVYQVNHNLESQKLQYAMEERLQQLGWREIEVVDDDLGRSAAGTVTRAGFERMVAEVCLGKVGAVAAREVSRFARNSREWQQLVEVCRVVDTVLIDQETVYTPTAK